MFAAPSTSNSTSNPLDGTCHCIGLPKALTADRRFAFVQTCSACSADLPSPSALPLPCSPPAHPQRLNSSSTNRHHQHRLAMASMTCSSSCSSLGCNLVGAVRSSCLDSDSLNYCDCVSRVHKAESVPRQKHCLIDESPLPELIELPCARGLRGSAGCLFAAHLPLVSAPCIGSSVAQTPKHGRTCPSRQAIRAFSALRA